MKTRRKILITILAIVLLYVVIVEVDNYFFGSLHQTSMHQSVENPNECWYHEDDGTMKPCVRDETMMLPLCMNLKSDYSGKCIVPLSGPDALCINGSLHYPPDENGVGKIIDDGC